MVKATIVMVIVLWSPIVGLLGALPFAADSNPMSPIFFVAAPTQHNTCQPYEHYDRLGT